MYQAYVFGKVVSLPSLFPPFPPLGLLLSDPFHAGQMPKTRPLYARHPDTE